MTTDTTNTTAAAIAAALTMGEREALKRLSHGDDSGDENYKTLEDKGLAYEFLTWRNEWEYTTTKLGDSVLAHVEALEAPPAATARPEAITVRQYYRENYVAKELKKECKVSVPGFPASWLDTVYDHQNHYTVVFQDHEGIHSMVFAPDETLEITWLDTATEQPAPQAGTGGEAFDWQARALKAETERDAYKADNTTLEHEAHTAKAREKMADHMADVHKEQYRQEHDNAFILYKALTRNTPKEVYQPVIESLFQSTNEYDKLMSEGSRWKERHQRATWKIEELESELASLRSELAASRERATVAGEKNSDNVTARARYFTALLRIRDYDNDDDIDTDTVKYLRKVALEALQPKDAASESEVAE